MQALRAVFSVLRTTFQRLGAERVPEAAASMGFYAVYSLFPLLLLLIAIGSQVLDTADAQERLLEVVLRLLPVSGEFVRRNVLAVLRVRGAVGWIGVGGLLWAATGAFGTLVRNLNRAWPCARPRHLLGERLLALAIVACLVGLVILYLLAKALVILPENWQSAQRGALSLVDQVPSEAALAGFILVILTLLYRWLPRTRVLWREAIAGAAACALALWGATSLFTGFLARGFVQYNIVYGSLGTLLALLTWVYIASLLVICGAHLAASIAAHTRNAEICDEPEEEGDAPSDAGTEAGIEPDAESSGRPGGEDK